VCLRSPLTGRAASLRMAQTWLLCGPSRLASGQSVVAPIYTKAMPDILTSPAEMDRWLETETVEQRASCITRRSPIIARAPDSSRKLNQSRVVDASDFFNEICAQRSSAASSLQE
jgi:hypothetical protein